MKPEQQSIGRLAPCPFCGTAGAKCDYTICDKASPDDTDRIWFINCCKCGADGPVDNYQRGAAEKWNRRAEMSAALPGDGRCVVCRKETPRETTILSSRLSLCAECDGPAFDAWWQKSVVPNLSRRLMAQQQFEPNQTEKP